MNKAQELEKISKEIENCNICKRGKIGKAVPGEGNADADVVFLGEAPGKKEAQTGHPFIGRSGNLLRKTLHAIGLKDQDVFITSPVKYLPEYVTPTPADIAHGKIHLDKQLAVINPKLIVMMGNTAAQAIFGEKIPVLKRHGEVFEKEGKKYFLTLHPAAAIRFGKFKKLFDEDFRQLAQMLKKI